MQTRVHDVLSQFMQQLYRNMKCHVCTNTGQHLGLFRRGTSGWTCEEWMDWSETIAPICLVDVTWPNGAKCKVKAVFDHMHRHLRNTVLHYLRGDLNRVGKKATEEARQWSFEYAATAERVRLSPYPYHAHACTMQNLAGA